MKVNRINAMNTKATMYLQEMIEVMKDMERSATSTIFSPVSLCTNCHPIVNGTAWEFDNDPAHNPETIDGFTRSMTISPVSRDPSTNEIEIPYNLLHDSTSTKMVTATITW